MEIGSTRFTRFHNQQTWWFGEGHNNNNNKKKKKKKVPSIEYGTN